MVNGVADVAEDRKVPTTPHWTYRQLNLLVRTGSDLVALVDGLAAQLAAARVRYAEMQVTPVRHRMAGIGYADLAQTPADGRALAIERHGVQLAGSPTPTPRSARRVPPRPSPSQPHTGPMAPSGSGQADRTPLGLVLAHVPANLPHRGGELLSLSWREALGGRMGVS